MCRSQAEGGRRCPGSHSGSSAAGHAGDSPRATHHHCYCAGSHEPGCPNYGDPDAMPPLADDDGERESYHGTEWQGYEEYQKRADDINRRVYEGESITEIMEAEQLRRGEERIAQIAREGW